MQRDDIKHLDLFAGAPDAEIDWMLDNSEIVTLPHGVFFQHQGEPVELFFVTLIGELQITRVFNTVPEVIGTIPPGIIGGDMSILLDQPSLVSAQAIMDSRLMVLDRPTFQLIFAFAPVIGSRILRIASQRFANVGRQVGQREKHAALGRLSAGLAHELNNPASAARRSAQTLRDVLPSLQHYTMSLSLCDLTRSQADALLGFQAHVLDQETPNTLSALEVSDREDRLGAWLEDLGFTDGYELASGFVERGVKLDDVQSLTATLDPSVVEPVLRWLHSAITATALMQQIDSSTQRISRLVDAVKAYTYMDQGETQDVDIHAGLENTLVVMHKKLGERMIVRQFGELPTITGRGSDLNEVWSNLLDNAIEATVDDGCISIITRLENQHVMIEIADNGHGIPQEIMGQVFEPFFTTKPLGEGIGLGLEICSRIVQQHQGTIELQSHPGQTRVIVRLPHGRALLN